MSPFVAGRSPLLRRRTVAPTPHRARAAIAGTKLPTLRAAAPEFYDDRPFHSSWVKVLIRCVSALPPPPCTRGAVAAAAACAAAAAAPVAAVQRDCYVISEFDVNVTCI